MTHLAVMQPYLFPYLGYYQLVHHVAEFVFFDDVSYIKKGYINRNSILLDGAPHRFTLPVLSASQNRLIRDHAFTDESASTIDVIARAYRKARYFDAVFALVEDVLTAADRRVSTVAASSITKVFDYLSLQKRFSFSSDIHKSPIAKGAEKIIEICRERKANRYTNAIGGKQLYQHADFEAHGIELEFLQMLPAAYDQGRREFVANLSMIDLLMHCSREQVRELLGCYVVDPGDLEMRTIPELTNSEWPIRLHSTAATQRTRVQS